MKNKSFRRFRAMVAKEFYHIIRDPSSIVIGGIFPLIFLFIYGFGVSLDADNLKVGVVMEDTSPPAQSFLQSLKGSRFLDIDVNRSREELTDQMVAGRIAGIVVIPSYFSEFLENPGETAPIQIISDASVTNLTQFVPNYVKGAWFNWLRERQINENIHELPLVNPQQRYWYNEELHSRNFLVPGSIAIIMTLIGTLLTAMVIAKEWERGTMEALMATPVTINELILGKTIPYFFIGIASMTLCTAISYFFFEVPLRGSLIVLLLITSLFLFTALVMGLLISTVAKSQFVAGQIATFAGFLPAFILSGFIFEPSNMPIPIQAISYLVPARYFVTILQTLFLVGDVWELFIRNMLPLILLGLIVLFITLKKTAKTLD